jgi:hypothetical protein
MINREQQLSDAEDDDNTSQTAVPWFVAEFAPLGTTLDPRGLKHATSALAARLDRLERHQ